MESSPAPRSGRHRLRRRVLGLLLVLATLFTATPAAAVDGFPDFPSAGFDMWSLGPSTSWDLVDSGYSLADVDPLSGANLGPTMTDAMSTQQALEPALMDTGLLALDAFNLAEQARLEAVARQQRATSGKLKAGAVPSEYVSLVEAAAASCPGLPVEILAAQLEAESNWNPRAVSPVGAQGLAQFMPDTWAQFGSGDPFNPANAIPAAARYDCYLLERTKNVPGDPISNMLAAYNAGEGRVIRSQGVPNIRETKNYVAKILAQAPQLIGEGDDSVSGTATGDVSTKGHSNGNLPDSMLCSIGHGSYRIHCGAVQGFKDLEAAYRANFGTGICVTDTYRSYAAQVAVKKAKPRLAAKPGTSNHGWGKAIDFCGGIQNFGTAQHRWMKANAGRYGWVHPGWAQAGGSKPEAWHWEYGNIS